MLATVFAKYLTDYYLHFKSLTLIVANNYLLHEKHELFIVQQYMIFILGNTSNMYINEYQFYGRLCYSYECAIYIFNL